MVRLPMAAAALVLAVVPALAADDHEMLAAEQELKIARDHLQAAGPEYAGHRRAAVDLIDRALREIHQGIQVSRGRVPELGPERKSRKEPSEQPDDD
jgi:hypothetical protein